MVNWEVFGAGLATMLIATFLYVLIELPKKFGIETRIPSAIPKIIFTIGFFMTLEAFGVFSSIYELIVLQNINLIEVIVGLIIVLAVPFSGIIEQITGYKISRNLKILLLVIGFILILGGLRVLPLEQLLSGLNKGLTELGIYILEHPYWLLVFLLSPIPIIYLWLTVFRRGGEGQVRGD